jgi:choline dehydrogenase-like flavoprotein
VFSIFVARIGFCSSNLTVLTHATVTRLLLEGKRTSGVEIAYDSKVHRIAGAEVVLALGAINTPKVLMQSGIGDQSELQRNDEVGGLPSRGETPAR